MLHNIKRLTRHSAVYGVGHIVSRSLNFLLLPIHANIFLPEEYRTPALLFSSLAILNVVFSYGMDVAFLRFFILADSDEEKRRIFSTAFWMILSTGVCFMGAMLLFPAPFSKIIFRSAQYITLVRLGAGILLADALTLIPFLVLRGEEKSTLFMLLKTLQIAINLALNIVLVVIMRVGIQGIFIANLVASVMTLGALTPIIARWLRPRFRKDTLGELLRFGIPYLPSGLAFIVMDQIGRFFLDRMAGEEAAGIFSANCKLAIFMNLIVAAFRFAWHPFFLSTSKQDDAPLIFARVLTYFLIVTGFFFLVISFFIEEIVHFQLFGISLMRLEYVEGIKIVPVVMLAYLMLGVYTNFVVGIYLKKKTVYIPFATGTGALVSVVVNILLIPSMGIMGAAWATFISYVVMALVLYLVTRRLYPIPYEIGRITKILIVFGGVFFLYTHIFMGEAAIYRVLLLASLFPLLWVFRFYVPDEISAVRKLLRGREGNG